MDTLVLFFFLIGLVGRGFFVGFKVLIGLGILVGRLMIGAALVGRFMIVATRVGRLGRMLEGVLVATGSTISDCVAVGRITIRVLVGCKVGMGVALAAGNVLLGLITSVIFVGKLEFVLWSTFATVFGV